MPPSRTGQQLERLAAIRRDPNSADAIETLRKALGDRSALVTAKAARIAGEAGLRELGPDLARAFLRLLDDVSKDKGCEGKKYIAEALRALGLAETEVFRLGIRHVQMEPVFGGRVDTAAELRASCALGLVDARDPDALLLAVDLLADPELRARIGAVKALGASGRPEAVLALRLKALLGDADSEVTTECFVELLEIDRRGSFDFVVRALGDKDPARIESAALALAATRDPQALAAIVECWRAAAEPALRRALLLAIGAMRIDEAVAFLIHTAAEGRFADAANAIEALAPMGADDAVANLTGAAVADRNDPRLTAIYEKIR